MNFKVVLIILSLFSSCSVLKNAQTNILLASGSLKSVENQNFHEILSEGRSILLGKFEIYLDDKDITKSCVVGLNGRSDRRNVVLYFGEHGDTLIDIERPINYFSGVGCGRNIPGVNFYYFFKKNEFRINGKVSNFGKYTLKFSSDIKRDQYRDGYPRSPYLYEISHSEARFAIEDMEKRYKIKSDSFVEIIKI